MDATDEPEETFAHEPLPTNEPYIRLVALSPQLSEAGGVQCRLRQVRFDDECPQYETLSYVWGRATDLVSIRCNGRVFKLTVTLRDALYRLRAPDKSRLLWIDQLTINQSDEEEKSRQVAMMREIYRRSSRTIAWLGTASEQATRAIDALQRIVLATVSGSLSNSTIWQKLQENGDTALHTVLSSKRGDWGTARTDGQEIHAIDYLLRQPWFTRMWIIQEACVSEKVRIVCERKEIDLDILLLGASIAMVARGPSGPVGMKGFLNLLILTRIREACSNGEKLPLPLLLESTRTFYATDPRDKFYALYGLTSTELNTMGIRPDYTLAMRHVYVHTTVSLVGRSENLNLLELAGGQREESEDLPTWVPAVRETSGFTWQLTNRGPPVHELSGKNLIRAAALAALEAEKIDGGDFEEQWVNAMVAEDTEELPYTKPLYSIRIPDYATSGDSRPSTLELDSNGVLLLSGQLVDKVKEISDVLRSPAPEYGELYALTDDDTQTLSEVIKNLWNLSGSALSKLYDHTRIIVEREQMVLGRSKMLQYPTGESLMTVYWKTICANHTIGSDEEMEKIFHKWRAGFRAVRFVHQMKSWASFTSFSVLTTHLALTIGRAIVSNKAAILSSVADISYERRLAWTHNGYLALLPAEAEEGDVVAILKGGRLPFVLRSQERAWQVIGPCYVHGIMNGEAYDEDACEDIRLL